MERVETRGGVPLETLGRGRAFAGIAAAACAGLLAGATVCAALLRGCVPAASGADALAANIRAGVYPDGDWDAEDGNLEPEKEKEVWAWRR